MVLRDEYENTEYWEELYASHRKREDFELYRFDWYFDGDNPFFKQILLNLLKPEKTDRILHLGCGKSNLQEKLWADGWTNVTNVDFSGTLIHDLRKQCDSLYHGLNFIELDCRNMNQLPDESFDLVIEKGLIDSVLCNSDPQRSIAQVLDLQAIRMQGIHGEYLHTLSVPVASCTLSLFVPKLKLELGDAYRTLTLVDVRLDSRGASLSVRTRGGTVAAYSIPP